MISLNPVRRQPKPWQIALRNVVTSPEELLQLLDLPLNLLPAACEAAQQFTLRVPRSFIARMKKGDPRDPLLQQVLPVGEELREVKGFSRDPLQEQHVNPTAGLLHKYENRVLVMITGACAVNCRYCFRRHFPYQDNQPNREQWDQIMAYLRQHETIDEVIFSGGDPLLANDQVWTSLFDELATIPHIKRVRIHSRIPIVLPERIDQGFLHCLAKTPLSMVMVVHCNHANELDHNVQLAIQALRDRNVTVLNQSVLLRGINDSVETLANLSHKLFDYGILPYYLHRLDKVQGTAHFDVTDEKARRLQTGLREKLSGYLVPRVVREVPGALFKVPF